MNLQSPLKRGTSRTGWIHNLSSLDDLKTCIVQGFGEDISGPACQWDKTLPCTESLYQYLGLKGHNGLDIACENGTEIFASHDGTATIGQDSAKGQGVVVTTDGFKTIYWHMLDFAVASGQQVKIGDLIGHADTTGYASGPHLHYGLKLLDNSGQVLNRDNGFDGAVDPTPYLVWFDMVLTLKEVEQLQALEGYSDPAGAQYWVGKTLDEYLAARIPDKVKTLQAVL